MKPVMRAEAEMTSMYTGRSTNAARCPLKRLARRRSPVSARLVRIDPAAEIMTRLEGDIRPRAAISRNHDGSVMYARYAPP